MTLALLSSGMFVFVWACILVDVIWLCYLTRGKGESERKVRIGVAHLCGVMQFRTSWFQLTKLIGASKNSPSYKRSQRESSSLPARGALFRKIRERLRSYKNKPERVEKKPALVQKIWCGENFLLSVSYCYRFFLSLFLFRYDFGSLLRRGEKRVVTSKVVHFSCLGKAKFFERVLVCLFFMPASYIYISLCLSYLVKGEIQRE